MKKPAKSDRPVALITGAHGGIGAACARVLSRRYRLLLTDRSESRLSELCSQLAADGAEIVGAVAGDLAAPPVLATILGALRNDCQVGAIVHTAGLSPALADWRAILQINLVATKRLVDGLEAFVGAGTVGVLIASIAGHSVAAAPGLDGALKAFDGGETTPLETLIQQSGDTEAMAGAAYGFSKCGVIRLVRERAAAWARMGARLVSISPGLIATPMGREEASTNPMAAQLVELTPMGRWGVPLDIANAAEFLCSDLASFITGCDLLVDGGLTALRATPTP